MLEFPVLKVSSFTNDFDTFLSDLLWNLKPLEVEFFLHFTKEKNVSDLNSCL